MELIKEVLGTINKYSMISEGDRILLGLSGGPDSVCLGIILHKLKTDFNLTLNAVYVDHGMRPDETGDEKRFCQTFCDRHGIRFFSRTVDVNKHARDWKLNRHEAARELRYGVYDDISREVNAARIALGHTADDVAETFLMRILNGSGRKGLSGIPPVRGKIIRPLIGIEKKAVEKFLIADSSHITHNSSPLFMVDSSNLKKDYLRNWVRLTLIPELVKKNPALIKNICRTVDILKDEDAYLELPVTEALKKIVSGKGDGRTELLLPALEDMEGPILRRLLRRVIAETYGLRGVEFIHIEDIIKLIKTGRPGDRLCLPGGIKAVRSYSTLAVTTEAPVKLRPRAFTPPGEILLDEISVMIVSETEGGAGRPYGGREAAVFDMNKISFPLQIRGRRRGDYFYPAGFGRKKKLQDFFVDEKVPRDERDRIPIVLSGDDILWVAGYRADERFRATDRTGKFLRLIISKKNS